MSKDNLVPKQITDKNGKKTTVHVKPGNAKVAIASKSLRLKPAGVQDVSDSDNPALLLQTIESAITLLDDPNWKDFPAKLRKDVVAAANNPAATDEVLALARELADACEAWNFHSTALLLKAAIDRSNLARDPDAPITEHYSLGFDPATPRELLERVFAEAGISAHSLAVNTSTPEHILEQFAEGEASWMRENIAKNRSASDDLLAKLSKDKDERVRYHVAENRSTPFYVLRELAKDFDNNVSESAKEALHNGHTRRG